jgi:hypothetical protein
LGWIFGGLWTIGWICAVCFAASIAKDLRVYDRTNAIEVPVTTTANKLTVKVTEPEIRYSGNIWWVHDNDNVGWDITDNTMKYNNVKVRVDKSEDSFYHIKYYKYSAGRSLADVQERAAQTGFNIAAEDSVLNLGSGLTINRSSKFRGQGVIVEIQVPVGKKIRFDESLENAYNPWVVRRSSDYRSWNRHDRIDWDYDDYFDWNVDQDYVMTSDGKLKKPEDVILDKKGVRELKTSTDSLKQKIEEREKQNERDRQKLEEMENKNDTQESTTRVQKKNKEVYNFIAMPFVPLVI